MLYPSWIRERNKRGGQRHALCFRDLRHQFYLGLVMHYFQEVPHQWKPCKSFSVFITARNKALKWELKRRRIGDSLNQLYLV
ncbi:hypothetical protein I3843_05G139600 [Carya illinoinensis]|nr:hypothetical protein I3843_05G139600 [Carya illinoinensis]